MTLEEHYRRLRQMYDAAPINEMYQPTMRVSEGIAKIEMEIQPAFLHAGRTMHGAVYFKMLDDAAFFAANSLEMDVFVLTTSFTTYMTRPVSSGKVRSVGKVVNQNKTQFIAEAILYDDQERELGRGNGIFVRSKFKLIEAMGYPD